MCVCVPRLKRGGGGRRGRKKKIQEAPGRQINVEPVRHCDRPASIPPAAAAAAGRTSAPSPARKRPERRSVLCFFTLRAQAQLCPGWKGKGRLPAACFPSLQLAGRSNKAQPGAPCEAAGWGGQGRAPELFVGSPDPLDSLQICAFEPPQTLSSCSGGSD